MAHDGRVTRLRIVVAAELIEDSSAEFPRIGDHVRYDLRCYEADPRMNPEMLNHFEARAELLNLGRISEGWTDPDGCVHPATYSLLLHGDGWGASLDSTTPLHGPVRISGMLEAEFPGMLPEEARVEGEVTDCRLITRTSLPGIGPGQQRAETDSLGPVRAGQIGFASGLIPQTPKPADSAGENGWWSAMIPPPDGPWIREAGLRVDLQVIPRSTDRFRDGHTFGIDSA